MTKKAIAKFRDYFAIRDNTSAEYIDWYVTADLKQVLSVYKQRNRKFYITSDFDFISEILRLWTRFIDIVYLVTDFYVSRFICKICHLSLLPQLARWQAWKDFLAYKEENNVD